MHLTTRYLAVELRSFELAIGLIAGLVQRDHPADWPHRLHSYRGHPEVLRLMRKAVFAGRRAAVRKAMGL